MTASLLEQLQTRAELCGVQLDSAQLANIDAFCTALLAYNQKVNLVSKSDLSFLLFEHVLDSLSLIPLLSSLQQQFSSPIQLADIGSGAGFPGLVLAILCPKLNVTLIEATAKKCKFLQEVIAALKLDSRTSVINARAEDIGHEPKYRDKFQFATVRAVGSIELIAELAIPLLQVGGYLLAQKSVAQIEGELAAAASALTDLGASVVQTAVLSKEALDKDHVVLVMKKDKPTANKFPRSFSKISKRKL
jgi:16S rRNA (guanine527-N7)-methyltransferase